LPGAHPTDHDLERVGLITALLVDEVDQVVRSSTGGMWPCRADSNIGTAPSQRAARRIGRRRGQYPATHTGGRGRCTVAGCKDTS
jgi:hypothetical protein